jgi:hypothetical protein
MPIVNSINSDDFGRDDVIKLYMVLQYFGAIAVTASTATSINNLDSDSITAPLAAAQGKALKGLIDTLTIAPVDGGNPAAATKRFQFRRGTSAQWTSNNPTLAQGELAVELDTLKLKVGDGTSNYNTLPYFVAAQNSLTPASSNLPPTVDAVNAALAAFGAPGVVGVNASNDITGSRALAAADFDGNVRRVTSAATLTIPTIATMGLSATPNQLRTIGFLNLSTLGFSVASGVTVNGVAGPASVAPIGGAPVGYGFYTLTQTAVGANTWALQ